MALHNEVQRYLLKFEGVPEYINMIKVAQRQAGRVGQTIADNTLILFASMAMLTYERFPCANDDREERAERDKTWAEQKSSHKRAHVQARVKAQANDCSAKLGTANSAAH